MSDGRTHERIDELLADYRLGQLSPEDRAVLEALEVELDASGSDDEIIGRLILALDEAAGENGELPLALRRRIETTGLGMMGKEPGAEFVVPRASRLPWVLVAASVAVAGVVGLFAMNALRERDQRVRISLEEVAGLRAQVETNRVTLAEARSARERLESELALSSEEGLALAERLARVTSDLDNARLEIARYEQPVDPAELQENRRRLLEVPDTIRVAWQPFDLPEAPAEQPGVQGDVVWNNELQTGYLRFVGLAANDPNVEQYQVWVIDERGMEQKVSGGVFNATADGELIVPIEPGIDVGRVAVFAVTVENPGGTWVPDLQRRVVVAPTG